MRRIIIAKSRFLLIVMLIVLSSCSEDVTIDVPEKEYRMVINSTISPLLFPNPQEVNATVSKSIYISDTSLNTELSDATVLLFQGDSLIDTLVYIDSTQRYSLNKFWFPSVGNTYTLKAEHDSYNSVMATTYIPSEIEIIDTVVTPQVSVDDDNTPYNEVAITFKDNPDEVNYYEIILSGPALDYNSSEDYYELASSDNLITRESYYPSLERFDIDKPKYLLFTDLGIEGEEYTLRFNYKPPVEIDRGNDIMISHYLTVQLRNITEEYYLFKTTWIQQQNAQVEDVLYGGSDPLNVYSNIENGYGIFGGFNYGSGTLFIDEVEY